MYTYNVVVFLCGNTNEVMVLHYLAFFFFTFRNGILKAGDRILKVNSNSVAKATLSEAIAFLKASDDVCIMEIEYDVTIHGELMDTPEMRAPHY